MASARTPNVWVCIGFDEALAHSSGGRRHVSCLRFEPCGLNQMHAFATAPSRRSSCRRVGRYVRDEKPGCFRGYSPTPFGPRSDALETFKAPEVAGTGCRDETGLFMDRSA